MADHVTMFTSFVMFVCPESGTSAMTHSFEDVCEAKEKMSDEDIISTSLRDHPEVMSVLVLSKTILPNPNAAAERTARFRILYAQNSDLEAVRIETFNAGDIDAFFENVVDSANMNESEASPFCASYITHDRVIYFTRASAELAIVASLRHMITTLPEPAANNQTAAIHTLLAPADLADIFTPAHTAARERVNALLLEKGGTETAARRSPSSSGLARPTSIPFANTRATPATSAPRASSRRSARTSATAVTSAQAPSAAPVRLGPPARSSYADIIEIQPAPIPPANPPSDAADELHQLRLLNRGRTNLVGRPGFAQLSASDQIIALGAGCKSVAVYLAFKSEILGRQVARLAAGGPGLDEERVTTWASWRLTHPLLAGHHREVKIKRMIRMWKVTGEWR